MNVLLALIPLSILMLILGGVAFFWAVDHDQFDDMETPSLLPLLDDPDTPLQPAGKP
ncbi:cbb3-type cytochrome oxidase assembly protein CcoS [Dokdonella sp.]|uniref:cbb3-type cytochrome oxidase assembly protein CcoS n=1 Tax=Dokdonella sp. TaxID=2291710 RepID=UPI002620D62B|nr:cbb3-type cytochrome oxidase assembly protein CcoS [Dokdonella sp.]